MAHMLKAFIDAQRIFKIMISKKLTDYTYKKKMLHSYTMVCFLMHTQIYSKFVFTFYIQYITQVHMRTHTSSKWLTEHERFFSPSS